MQKEVAKTSSSSSLRQYKLWEKLGRTYLNAANSQTANTM